MHLLFGLFFIFSNVLFVDNGFNLFFGKKFQIFIYDLFLFNIYDLVEKVILDYFQWNGENNKL